MDSISRFLGTLADPPALERFWRATCDGRVEFYNTYPDIVKDILRTFGQTFGGSLAELSDSQMVSGTFTQRMSILTFTREAPRHRN